MNPIIVNQYKIVFHNQVVDFPGFGKEVVKSVDINNGHLEDFLLSWQNPQEINELLLPDVNNAINGLQNEIENGSETISILIYNDRITMYPENDAPVDIPITDFKAIIEGWRDFLLTPPLNGKKI